MSSPEPVTDRGFTEVADRVWVARHGDRDSNVTLVEGDAGLVVVDTLGSAEAARELLAWLRMVSGRDVVALVNTHHHRGHVGGNALLRGEWPGARLHAHDEAAPRVGAVDRTFCSVDVIDLGDRVVELVHPGRGHTDGDLVARVPDAHVLAAGDLLAAGTPSYGPDCFPLDWPTTLDFVVGLVTPDWVLVPGHGALVDQSFATGQRTDVGTVAETVFDLASRRVPIEDAWTGAGWPFPAERLTHAVRRGYEQVPRTARRLPLV